MELFISSSCQFSKLRVGKASIEYGKGVRRIVMQMSFPGCLAHNSLHAVCPLISRLNANRVLALSDVAKFASSNTTSGIS